MQMNPKKQFISQTHERMYTISVRNGSGRETEFRATSGVSTATSFPSHGFRDRVCHTAFLVRFFPRMTIKHDIWEAVGPRSCRTQNTAGRHSKNARSQKTAQLLDFIWNADESKETVYFPNTWENVYPFRSEWQLSRNWISCHFRCLHSYEFPFTWF